ncbi:tyrosine recombinase XerS [Marinicrinis lubricantis]|uniref:Tyrosine recombinase XerS n=1 Tax=Marinicrinis lubricantis TaxID=2086470 RepID=A0ABW1IK47_9BACL
MNLIKQHDQKLLENKTAHLPWFVVQFIEHKLPERSPSSLLEYARDFELFFRWLIGEGLSHASKVRDITLMELEALTIEQIDSYKLFLQIKRQNGLSSRERKIASLKSLFHYLSQIAEDEQHYPLLKRNVMAKLSSHRLLHPDLIATRLKGKILEDDEEIGAFIEYIMHGYLRDIQDNKQALHYYQMNRIRDLAMIQLILSSGLRVSEIYNLNIEDIDMNKKLAHVYRKGVHDQTLKQGVFFAEAGKNSLHQYLTIRQQIYQPIRGEKALFLAIPRGQKQGKRMSKRAIQQMVTKYAKAFGKPYLSVHKLRHSFATSYYAKNDIYKTQKQLGHSSTETTQIYAQLTDKTMAHAIEKYKYNEQ